MNNKSSNEPNVVINVVGEVCPVPLIRFRKALRSTPLNAIIEMIGDDESSRREIPMAVEELRLSLIAVYDENGKWRILIKKTRNV
ncbi:MAG: sulfurtransferase TusA family protein [Candidatus Asgardarchaeum californiense]|nr:MAG: sulfurtransferase TusA family protein [Candidatus Asgardarchaeum californiense]